MSLLVVGLASSVQPPEAAVDDSVAGRQLNTATWLRTHPWARPPPPPFADWSGATLDDYVKTHNGVETKLSEQGFNGAAVVELLTSNAHAEELIKEAVPGRTSDRLQVLHLLRKIVRPSPPPPPPLPPRPVRPPVSG